MMDVTFAAHLRHAQQCLAEGNSAAAQTALARAAQAEGSSGEQLYQLALLFRQLHQNQPAMQALERCIACQPDYARAYVEAGQILIEESYPREAAEYLKRGLQLSPTCARGWAALAHAHLATSDVEQALAALCRGVELVPQDVHLHLELGRCLIEHRRLAEASTWLERSLAWHPHCAPLRNLLGATYEMRKASGPAVEQYRQAVALDPQLAEAWCNLGNALGLQGNLEEALAAYRRALAVEPDLMWAHSNLVFTMLFHAPSTPQEILAENRRWNARFAAPLRRARTHWPNTRQPHRGLRIGYVSPDMCAHPVGRFMLPVLTHHDRQRYPATVYSTGHRTDETTTQLRHAASCWRDVGQLDDESLTQLIGQDQIDILVDLSMHMAHHRLLVFARKPAPIQVSYLAYVGTTGLEAIDYRFTDGYLDPTADCLAAYAEQSMYLPHCYWCYRPVLDVPLEPELPADRNPHVTLGSFNNFCKVTPPALDVWCRILRELPQTRLRITTGDRSQQSRLESTVTQWGIDPRRLEMVPHVGLREYFAGISRVDIALDPFPYGGGTTTCDALWMGVPVVSLAGHTAVGRGGVSILSNVGLPELIARDPSEYVSIVGQLCSQRGRLRQLRSGLREQMSRSPLMDERQFAADIEGLYRVMWERWCGAVGAQGEHS